MVSEVLELDEMDASLVNPNSLRDRAETALVTASAPFSSSKFLAAQVRQRRRLFCHK